MSLINDALRKARQAAAEREDGRIRDPFRVRAAHPRGAPRRSAPFALLAVAVVASLVGASLVWVLTGRSERSVEMAPSIMRAEVSPIPSFEADSLLEPSSTDVDPSHVDQATPADPPSDREKPAARPQPLAVDSPAVKPTAPEADPPPGTQPTLGEGGAKIYVLDADLGSTKLSLGYIVAREQNPFAEINGRDVYLGSEIEGFTVEAIEADRVVLRNESGELVLKVP